MTRHARAIDGNQGEIVKALRAAGYEVRDMHKAGYGVFDLLVRRGAFRCWVEVKQAGGAFTDDEHEFMDWAPGPFRVVWSAQDAVDKLSVLEGEKEQR